MRTRDGRIAIDPVTGEARRVDFAIIQQGQSRGVVEVTSKTAGKAGQLAKERRIRQAGGTFVRDRLTGELIDISETPTRLFRRR